ncbi:integral membrane protein TIGR01906 [Alkaliphilus metalliredigens QYMF]|uniref:Integral membrane protein TIGR01906 n=1 Tax=Alkaliphilus metalliredigens (strain QYMF) TaxID=293826 RepID=A6TT93_ALKMQ|nr:TIGR01906 family membrane protein [Alkaliphilus metalliredigens]ABR49411.1 integral membrane protein TIGR01906 [Alkaliphilus metalliredigens QYMF]
MKSKHIWIYSVMGVLLTIVILLTSVEIVAFNSQHYRSSFEKYNITEVTGMDMDNLEYAMADLLSYVRDEKDVLDTSAIVNGELREVFGERERMHMVDVKELFIKGRVARNLSFILLVGLSFILLIKDTKWKMRLLKTLVYTAIGNIALLGVFLLLLYMDFNKYFTYFHLIFFDNDLWILDPQKEILIQMVPEGFFYDTSVKIIGLFIGTITAIGVVAGSYIRFTKFKSS